MALIFFSCSSIFLSTDAQGLASYIPRIVPSPTILCEGDILTLYINDAYPKEGGSPIDSRPLIMQDRMYSEGATACNYSGKEYYFDATGILPQVTGDNVLSVDTINTGTICSPTYSIIIKAKPSKSGTYRINWKAKYTFNNYPSYPTGSYDIYEYDASIYIQVVNLSKPSISASKQIILPTETSTLTATGCSNSSDYQWKDDCQNMNWNLLGNPLNVNEGKYRVRCTQAGCMGEPSDPVEVVVKPILPTSTCNLGEIDENGYLKNREDYHEYFKVTEICDKSEAGCTVQNIFSLMKSDYRNTAPQWGDFTLLKTTSSLGMKLMSSTTKKPSSNCLQVTLKTPFSYPFSLSQFGKIIIPCLTNNGNYFGDPIVQTVDDNSYSISNITLPGHPFHPGKVINTIYETDCKVYIKSIGLGNSNVYECCKECGILMAQINKSWGLSIFENVAIRLKKLFDIAK